MVLYIYAHNTHACVTRVYSNTTMAGRRHKRITRAFRDRRWHDSVRLQTSVPMQNTHTHWLELYVVAMTHGFGIPRPTHQTQLEGWRWVQSGVWNSESKLRINSFVNGITDVYDKISRIYVDIVKKNEVIVDGRRSYSLYSPSWMIFQLSSYLGNLKWTGRIQFWISETYNFPLDWIEGIVYRRRNLNLVNG